MRNFVDSRGRRLRREILVDARVAAETRHAGSLKELPHLAAPLARACTLTGETRHVPSLAAALSPWSGRNVVVGITASFGPADRYLAYLAALSGSWDDAERHVRRASTLARQMDAGLLVTVLERELGDVRARRIPRGP